MAYPPRVDETCVKVEGAWSYLCRAVDSLGQTIDFLLSAQRDAAAAKRLFRKAPPQPHTVNPRTITVDKNPAYPRAAAAQAFVPEPMRVELAHQIRGVLKPFGLVAGKGGGQPFMERVRSLVAGGPLQEVAEALLAAWQAIGDQAAALSRRLVAIARQDQAVRRLMTAPGVGVGVAPAYVSVIDDPERFARSSSVGAHAGLTPRRFQPGEEDHTGRTSRCGDPLLRKDLFGAAGTLLHRVAKWPALKTWGARLAKRIGASKATAAAARKRAGILHRTWKDGSEFRWSAKEQQAA